MSRSDGVQMAWMFRDSLTKFFSLKNPKPNQNNTQKTQNETKQKETKPEQPKKQKTEQNKTNKNLNQNVSTSHIGPYIIIF